MINPVHEFSPHYIVVISGNTKAMIMIDVKRRIDHDLRVKLIISLTYLGVIPNEVTWLYDGNHMIPCE